MTARIAWIRFFLLWAAFFVLIGNPGCLGSSSSKPERTQVRDKAPEPAPTQPAADDWRTSLALGFCAEQRADADTDCARVAEIVTQQLLKSYAPAPPSTDCLQLLTVYAIYVRTPVPAALLAKCCPVLRESRQHLSVCRGAATGGGKQ